MSISANSNLTNSYTTGIAARTTQLLSENLFLSSILAPMEDLRPMRVGNTVRVLRDPKGTVRDVNDDRSTTNSSDAPTPNYDEITLDYYRTVSFEWGQKDQVIGNAGITIDRYSNSGNKQLGGDIVGKVLQDIVNDANVPAGNEIGTVGNVFDLEVFTTLIQKFTENEVPEEDRVIILSPLHYKQLLDQNFIQSKDYLGSDTLTTGKLPLRLFGFEVYVSTRLQTNDNLASITGSDTTKISVAMDKKSVLFTMAEIEAPADSTFNFSKGSIDGFSVANYIWFDAPTRTNKIATDCIYGTKVVLTPTTTNASDVCNVFPILGGVKAD